MTLTPVRNGYFAPLPEELWVAILDKITNFRTVQAISWTCRDFNRVMEGIEQIRPRCVTILNLIGTVNEQLKKMSKETPGIHHSVLSSRTICYTTLMKNTISDFPRTRLESIFVTWKEIIIDGLSILPPPLLEKITFPEFKERDKPHFADIKEKAGKRIRIAIFPETSRCLSIIDEKGRIHRSHGNYGTQGGPLLSLYFSIENPKKQDPAAFHLDNSIFIDRWLPCELFLQKTDDDSVRFTLQDKEIKLVCKGIEDNGHYCKFESIFADRLKSFRLYDPNEFDPPISEEKQKDMVNTLIAANIRPKIKRVNLFNS